MAPGQSSAIAHGRPPAGQLLTQLSRRFQAELAQRLREAKLEGARVPHVHVTAYLRPEGSRLTELAHRAGLTRPAMVELVDDLERLGFVERRPDPADRRAKLICLTTRGRHVTRTSHEIIAELEAEYAGVIGAERFEAMCDAIQALLDPARPSG
jgi:DNA-binding MarR family transcriptional regulator